MVFATLTLSDTKKWTQYGVSFTLYYTTRVQGPIFAQSDAMVTIYFPTLFRVASI